MSASGVNRCLETLPGMAVQSQNSSLTLAGGRGCGMPVASRRTSPAWSRRSATRDPEQMFQFMCSIKSPRSSLKSRSTQCSIGSPRPSFSRDRRISAIRRVSRLRLNPMQSFRFRVVSGCAASSPRNQDRSRRVDCRVNTCRHRTGATTSRCQERGNDLRADRDRWRIPEG